MKFKRVLSMVTAAVMLCGCMSGCGGKKTTAALEDPNTVPEDTYEIQWYLMADPQNDTASVEAALNDYLKDKINATVKMICLPSGQYTSKLGTMINAGEYFDLAFVARWALDYIDNSRSGAFYDLSDHLDTYLKDTTEIIGKDYLEYSRVDGKLYALPVYKEIATQYGWIYRKDIADKYNIDMSKYKSFEELEPVLKMIKENEPDMKYPIDWAYGGNDPGCLVQTESFIFKNGSHDNKPVNVYATEEYKKACETARDFYNKGYVRPDVLTATDQLSRMSEGLTFVQLQPIKPGKAKELFKDSKYEFDQVPVQEPMIDYLSGTGSMQAVSATSKNPARVMRFLNLLNSDPYVKNLVIHGIEGKHYEKVNDTQVRPIENSGYSHYKESWAIGNVFLDYVLESDDADKNEQLKAFNAEAIDSDVNGFLTEETDDPEMKQIAMEVGNAINNYDKQLRLGVVDVDSTLAEYLDLLDKAGMEKQLAEIDKQWTEYLKNK